MSNEKKKTALPKLRFPEFRVAAEWQKSKLGEVSEIVRGGSPRPIEDFITTDPNGLNWLKIGDVAPEAKYIFKTQQKVIWEALSKTREVSPGDLILSNSMSFGRPYIMKTKSCIHDGWIAIRHISDDVLTDYLYYAISSESSQIYFVANAAGAAVLNLNAERIKVLPLAIPSIEEQQKIAATLSSLDDLITAQNTKLAAFQTHKRGLMQVLFPVEGETIPKLRFPEFQEAEEWEEMPLGKVCEVLNNRRKPITSIHREKGQYPYYGASGIVDYVKDFIFDERLLLVGEDGAKWGAYENTAFIVEGKYWVNNHAHVLRPLKINDTLLEQYLVKLDLAAFVTGAAPPKLTLGKLKEIPIPVPPTLEEQQKLADCLSSIDNLITAQTQKIEALKLHKKGLMQSLFPALTITEV